MRDVLTAIQRGDRITTLTGHAGAGKTTLTGEIVQAVGCGVKLAATTHKAAKVLSAKTGAEVGTVHSLLGLRLKKMLDGTERCVPEGEPRVDGAQVVIVDEASMIGADLFGHIKNWSDTVQFLLIGDPAQLPPVGEGTSPAFDSEAATQVHLDGIVRQAAGNPIIQLAQEVRVCEGIYPREKLLAWADDRSIYRWEQPLWELDTDTGLVAYRNTQVNDHNRRQHEMRYPGVPGFAVGEQIVFNEAHELSEGAFVENNMEGVVAAIQPSTHFGIETWCISLELDDGASLRGHVPRRQEAFEAIRAHLWNIRKRHAIEGRDDEAKAASRRAWAFSKAFLPLRHTYASTVHKSQGSTHETTVIDVNDLYRNKDTGELRKLLYTAITRPSDRLVLYVGPSAPGATWQQKQDWIARWREPQEPRALNEDLLRRVLALCHPDKHNGSALSTRTFQELMDIREGGLQ